MITSFRELKIAIPSAANACLMMKIGSTSMKESISVSKFKYMGKLKRRQKRTGIWWREILIDDFFGSGSHLLKGTTFITFSAKRS